MSASTSPHTAIPLSERPSPIPPAPVPNTKYAELASERQIERTAHALESAGIEVVVVPDKAGAREAVLQRLPNGAEVLDATSQTLAAIGLPDELQKNGRFRAVRPRLMQLSEDGNIREQRKLGAAPDYVVGSVHAITENGQVVIASASGSQLGPYAYGAGKLIWVVGAQKIVRDLDDAFRRIEEYTFPLEDARARKAYGMGSAIAKLLVVNRELQPGRITVILVKENLGF